MHCLPHYFFFFFKKCPILQSSVEDRDLLIKHVHTLAFYLSHFQHSVGNITPVYLCSPDNPPTHSQRETVTKE